MDKNSQLHSGPEKERQFVKADERNAYNEIYSLISKKGLEKGAKILAHRLLQCDEEQNAEMREQERKRKKRKAVYIVVLEYVILGILGTCFFEWLGSVVDQNGIIWANLPWMSLLIAVIQIIPEIIKMFKMPGSSYIRKEDEGIAEGMLASEGNSVHQFSKASGLHVRLLFMAVIVISVLLARCAPFAHLKAFWSGGIYAINHYDNNNNGNDFINNSINDNIMQAGGKQDKVIISRKIKEYLTGSDEVMIEQLDRMTVTNEQRNIAFKLSEEDYYKVFSCWEDGLREYRTQEQLNEKVLSEVWGWCDQKLDNVFNRELGQGGAPQEVRNRISEVSISESQEDDFSKIADRLDLRESVVREYPKRDLMQLVANDYQGLALRLVWHEGVQSTIIYYYGQSILFDFECLKFADNTDKTIKERLTVIAQRYEDIAYVCPKFEGAEEARRLAAAFRYAADQY